MGDDAKKLFRALTGHAPILWQQRLSDELLAGRVPNALDIPTGLGKTSIIALWLVARALGALLPRRLVYVVDRRVVVDQATNVAVAIRERTDDDSDLGAALKAGVDGLAISTLRGGLADNRDWFQDPTRPAIVIGTVDMIGSRLLFRGYGVSRRLRPVHAALLGTDSLIVLDEAHLVPPFEALLEQVAVLAAEDTCRSRLPAIPLKVLALSATGRSRKANPFTLSDDERAEPVAAARLNAPKRLLLQPTVDAAKLPGVLADLAVERAGADGAVLVYCDSRKTAQITADAIKKALPKDKDKDKMSRVELLVGERRVRERQRLAESDVYRRFQPRGTDAHAASKLSGPAFLVATSAGEVGADLDADHLVAWERMVQRLGRVNRRVVPSEALVDVFPSEREIKDKDVEDTADKARLAVLRAPFEALAA